MSQIPFEEKTKESLLEIVRLSGVLTHEEADKMTQLELATHLANLDFNETAKEQVQNKKSTAKKTASKRSTSKKSSSKKESPSENITIESISTTKSETLSAQLPATSAPTSAESMIESPVSDEVFPLVEKETTHKRKRRSKTSKTVSEDLPLGEKKTAVDGEINGKEEILNEVEAIEEKATDDVKKTKRSPGRKKSVDKQKNPSESSNEQVPEIRVANSVEIIADISADVAENTENIKARSSKVKAKKTGKEKTKKNGKEKTTDTAEIVEDLKPENSGTAGAGDINETSDIKYCIEMTDNASASESKTDTDDSDNKDSESANSAKKNKNRKRSRKKNKVTAEIATKEQFGIDELGEIPTELELELDGKLPVTIANDNDKTNAKKSNNESLTVDERLTGGVLEIMPDGYGFLRSENFLPGNKDAFVPTQFIRRFAMRQGDFVSGPTRVQRDNDRNQALFYVKTINNLPPDKLYKRPRFDKLTPIYPDERYKLETQKDELSTRIIDFIAPIGKGQRGMIVSPPKAGKTILLKKIANAISTNNPQVKLLVLLIDERPEEVTDMQRSIKGEVAYSTFDKTPENHVKIAELVLERAMRLVEMGEDVVILLDSITRLARAYNLTINPTGRTLSGGLDPGALYGPKRFFGAARNIENGGSLTIIATSLIDTGSRMDEVIFEEFKGTGNMEVYLDRKLSEKRIFPAIDINRSGTRREELLLTNKELEAVWSIRKALGQLDNANVTEMIINLLLRTSSNDQFVSSVNISFNDKALFDTMKINKN